ncbi:MAG: response regulator, partial [Bacteroidetes Order II. Incertae sedis bacterium]|nr:response regulator [Bacteroidetes Order II. bacterium]
MGIRSKNILLTDDNLMNQQVASRMLRKFGHEVDIYSSGFEAIEAIRTKQFDLVLMDMMMPEMDGITASREIRRQLGKACPPI